MDKRPDGQNSSNSVKSKMIKEQKPAAIKRKASKPVKKAKRKIDDKPNFEIPRASFNRLSKEVLENERGGFRITKEAAEAVQTEADVYLTQHLRKCNIIASESGRKTILGRDSMTVKKLEQRPCM